MMFLYDIWNMSAFAIETMLSSVEIVYSRTTFATTEIGDIVCIWIFHQTSELI